MKPSAAARPPQRRHDARERALDLLYEADVKGLSGADVIGQLPVVPDEYTAGLVRGVGTNEAAHDELIRRFLRTDWTFSRMPILDRILLRIAIEELSHRPDVPTAVVIDEAVELAKQFSTEDSGKFVNGMLSNIAAVVRP